MEPGGLQPIGSQSRTRLKQLTHTHTHQTVRKKNNKLGTGVVVAGVDETAEKGRGQFTASFVLPDKKVGCFPVAESESVRINT